MDLFRAGEIAFQEGYYDFRHTAQITFYLKNKTWGGGGGANKNFKKYKKIVLGKFFVGFLIR